MYPLFTKRLWHAVVAATGKMVGGDCCGRRPASAAGGERVVPCEAPASSRRLANFFDVAAGSGASSVLTVMLVAGGAGDAWSLLSAEDALAFLMRGLRLGWLSGFASSLLALFRSAPLTARCSAT